MIKYWIFSVLPITVGPDSLSMFFCKTETVKCKPLFIHNGKTYLDTCTSDSIGDPSLGIKEEFFWCATEVDDSNNMVNWGVCDIFSCKLNINCNVKHIYLNKLL